MDLVAKAFRFFSIHKMGNSLMVSSQGRCGHTSALLLSEGASGYVLEHPLEF